MTARKLLAWAAVVLAAGYCALAAGWYAQARTADARTFGAARDTALSSAREELAQLNTVDAAHPDDGLRRWLDATTGPLRDQLRSSSATDLDTLRRDGTSAHGSVTDAALTELDTRAGTARLIATVTVDLTPKSGLPSTDRKRFEAGLARTADGWRITSLTAVPVGAS
ncbi:hypothetical protein [Kitasatospora sp. McL0602]|uniref:hypothetical protein n=1 Tax=Kitasatospora sp. McL0602 TaxID=3439530 RepID=UPI003F88B733